MPVTDEERRRLLIREKLLSQGYDSTLVDQQLFGGPAFDVTGGQVPGAMRDSRAIEGLGRARLELDEMRQEGAAALADSIPEEDLATYLLSIAGDAPVSLHNALDAIRTGYANARFDVSTGVTQAAGDMRELGEANPITKFIAGLLGSDVANLAMGGAEVLGRPQQVLYGLLSGEGGAAFQRLVPRVIINDESEGGTKELTPLSAAWHALTGGTDDWEQNIDELKQVNAAYANTQLLEFHDVMDAWVGHENMDEVYDKLYTGGIFGKIGAAGLATTYAIAEIFADPLLVLDSVPTKAVQAGRKLGTTAQRAAATARRARHTNRLPDLQAAAGRAKTHLEAMQQQHSIERSMGSMHRLQQAERNYAERIDAILAQQNAQAVDRVYTGPVRGNPNVQSTREVMRLPFEIKPESPTRFNAMARARRVVDDIDEQLARSAEDLKALKASGSPATAEDVTQLERQLQKLERWKRRIVADPEDIPDVIEFETTFIRTRTADELAAIQQAERKAASLRPTTQYQPRPDDSLQRPLFEPEQAARIANGPDDAEYAAEGLARMVDGADIDELGTPIGLNPEFHHETGGRRMIGVNDGLIDLDQVERSLAKARNAATKEQRTVYDAALKEIKRKKATGEDLPFDEAWLPSPRKNIEDEMWDDWIHEYGATFGDQIAQALAPRSWYAKLPGLLRRPLMHLREPMRVLEEMDPGKSWPLLRNAMLNGEAEKSRLQSVMHDAYQRLGALEMDDPGPIRQALVTDARPRVRINKERSAEVFDMLQTPRDSEAWGKMLAKLTPDEQAALQQIRREFDLYAEKLGFTGTDKFVEGYMPHAFDEKWFEKGAMPPEMRGMHRNGHVFLSHMLRRTGQEGYIKDAVALTDMYIHGVTRKVYLEPALQTFRRRAATIARQRGNQWYAKYADLVVSQMKGEPSLMGRLVDHTVGSLAVAAGKNYKPGDATRKLMAIPSFTYAAVLAGNRRYPIMSIATALATTGAKYGLFRTIKGMFMSATPEGQAVFKSMGGQRLWTEIFEHQAMNRFTETMSGGRFLTPSIQDSEHFIRGMTFWAAIDEMLNRGGFATLADARRAGLDQKVLFDALRTTEEVNHFFGVGAKPPVFSKISKSGSALATQFLSFGPKQTEMLAQLAGENPGHIARYLMLSGWMTRVAAQDMGMDLSDYLGVGYTRNYGIRDVATPGVEALLGNVRLMATMSDFMGGHATHEDAQKAVDEWAKTMENLVPLLGATRGLAKSLEATITGEQRVPGLGYARDVDTSLSGEGKGARGEAVSLFTGTRSVRERAVQDARRRIRGMKAEVSFERMVLAEKAYRAMKDGDTDGMMRQVQRLAALGVPFGDISNSVKTRAEVEMLHWHYIELVKNPNLAHKILPILGRYGIMRQEGQ